MRPASRAAATMTATMMTTMAVADMRCHPPSVAAHSDCPASAALNTPSGRHARTRTAGGRPARPAADTQAGAPRMPGWFRSGARDGVHGRGRAGGRCSRGPEAGLPDEPHPWRSAPRTASIGIEGRGSAHRASRTGQLWRVAGALVFSADEESYAWLHGALGVWEGEFDAAQQTAR